MLEAARSCFARDSYENVGLRDVSGMVGVDPALVCRYFGNKEELFREVLRGEDHDDLFAGQTAETLPAHLAGLICDKDQSAQHRAEKLDRLLIIMRSASSPNASEIVRKAMETEMLEPIADRIGGEDAMMRASLALSLLMGSGILASVMALDPISECNPDDLRARLTSLFRVALEVASNDG
ncbi:MAG: TetR family transcriptional regulator [Pseudomonadota bacterium]